MSSTKYSCLDQRSPTFPKGIELLLALVALNILIVRATIDTLETPASRAKRQRLDDVKNALRNDPLIGEQVGLGIKGPAVLVYAMLCSCDAQSLAAMEVRSKSGVLSRIIMPTSPQAIEKHPLLLKYKHLFIFDADRTIASKLNAAFTPRAYVLDAGGNMNWKSASIVDSWLGIYDQAVQVAAGGKNENR